PGKRGPEFVRSADLQSPPHKWHGFRILTHNPEVVRSNRTPATITTRNGGFFVALTHESLRNKTWTQNPGVMGSCRALYSHKYQKVFLQSQILVIRF
ncbi:MAG: hypothetical protein CVU43_12155, partial [Chloroflexi bacterium HGW-Chloroflexi-5]